MKERLFMMEIRNLETETDKANEKPDNRLKILYDEKVLRKVSPRVLMVLHGLMLVAQSVVNGMRDYEFAISILDTMKQELNADREEQEGKLASVAGVKIPITEGELKTKTIGQLQHEAEDALYSECYMKGYVLARDDKPRPEINPEDRFCSEAMQDGWDDYSMEHPANPERFKKLREGQHNECLTLGAKLMQFADRFTATPTNAWPLEESVHRRMLTHIAEARKTVKDAACLSVNLKACLLGEISNLEDAAKSDDAWRLAPETAQRIKDILEKPGYYVKEVYHL